MKRCSASTSGDRTGQHAVPRGDETKTENNAELAPYASRRSRVLGWRRQRNAHREIIIRRGLAGQHAIKP